MKYRMTIHYVQNEERTVFEFEDERSIAELKDSLLSTDMDKLSVIKDTTNSIMILNWREVRNAWIQEATRVEVR